MYGHPGVGKSTLAQQLSINLAKKNKYKLDRNFFYIFSSSLLNKSKWHGETLRSFKKIINYIRSASKKIMIYLFFVLTV